ncbi:hypothetical protein EIN_375080 [Entamoeba invadens IP1]|uniref:Uncharacterized protein n=1 Tax=Entamoeba invadens IP1 TaxID=370355 RepID=A0A0A1TVX5_ENTIV|nr:hypothetical protein EIN_375080 [Entamoeba invadens IP1]ELP83433.1 hypothetical protein EIN_375080 [Entamoeba invadens IP1]|eukprot:XP_004182779.1 hypothetical protein EIN_375080 [Entamoeba invadens IP1]
MKTLLFVLFACVQAEDLMLYDDGSFYEEFGVVNPDNLNITCVYTKRSNWVAATMKPGNMLVFTRNGTISTKIEDKDKYYKSIRFMVRFDDSGDVKYLPLNVKVFNQTFDDLYNQNLLNSNEGYTVKIKKNNSQKMTIKLDNFNLDGGVSTIIFTRTGNEEQEYDFLIDQLRLDTKNSQNEEYETENGVSSFFVSCVVILLLSLF